MNFRFSLATKLNPKWDRWGPSSLAHPHHAPAQHGGLLRSSRTPGARRQRPMRRPMTISEASIRSALREFPWRRRSPSEAEVRGRRGTPPPITAIQARQERLPQSGDDERRGARHDHLPRTKAALVGAHGARGAKPDRIDGGARPAGPGVEQHRKQRGVEPRSGSPTVLPNPKPQDEHRHPRRATGSAINRAPRAA